MGKWPYPGDTPTDIARAVARSAVRELALPCPNCSATSDRADRLVALVERLGQGWIRPDRPLVTPGELVGTAEAAQLVSVSERTVRAWAADEDVPVWRYPGGYDPEELLAWAGR